MENIKLEDAYIIVKILKIIINYRRNQIIENIPNEELKKKAVLLFINKIIEINIKSNNKILGKFISCFQIKELLVKNYSSKEQLLSLNNDIVSLFFIKYFKLKDNFSFKEFNIIKNNRIEYCVIILLFNIYNSSNEELLNLAEYILSKIGKNCIPFEYIKIIFIENQKNKKIFNEKIKKILAEEFMKLPEVKTDKIYTEFYKFIFKNKLQIYLPQYTNNIFFEKLINEDNFINSAFELIKAFPKEKISTVEKDSLRKLLYSFELENIENILFLIEYLPEELNTLASRYIKKKKNYFLLNLLKKIKITYNIDKYKLDDEIIKEVNKLIIAPYYHHKIKTFSYNHIGRLIEFVKNQTEFEIFFQKILIKIKKLSKTDTNIIEELSYILKYAQSKKYILPQIKNMKSLEIINEAKKIKPYIPEDKFGPITPNCLAFSREEINVIFVNKDADLIKYFDLYLKNTEFIGIDTEWRQSLEINNKTKTSIMQLSDFEGKNILILDLIELNKDPNFEDNFVKLFMGKKFIGYDFKNDLDNFTDKFKLFFKEKADIVDIKKAYSGKFQRKCPTLSKLCEEMIGKPLCKYEQCLNWEERPLRESQLHYAALDSILCCLIYKKIIEN